MKVVTQIIILKILKFKTIFRTAGYLGPDSKQEIEDSFADIGIRVDLEIVTLVMMRLCVGAFQG